MEPEHTCSMSSHTVSDRFSISTVSTVLPSYQDALQSTPVGDAVSNPQPQNQQVSPAVPRYSTLATPSAPPVPGGQQCRGGGPSLPPRRTSSLAPQPALTPRRNSEVRPEAQATSHRVDDSSATSVPLLPPRPVETVLQWTPPPPAATPEPPSPSQPLTYTFSPFAANSMLLLPPSTALDTRPKYHISVRQDCFMPLSFITTVRRGSSETGEYVGEFEMGISTQKATCTIGGMQEVLHIDFKKDPSSSNKHAYQWRFGRFHWKTLSKGKIEARCYYASSNNAKLPTPLAAVFTPRDMTVRPRPLSSVRPATLEVTPDGQAHFDAILFSALIMERRRLTPRTPESFVNEIFSHNNVGFTF